MTFYSLLPLSTGALTLAAWTALGLAAAGPTAAQDFSAQNFNGQPVQVTERFPDKATVVINDGTQIITPAGATYSFGTLSTTVTPTQIRFSSDNSAFFGVLSAGRGGVPSPAGFNGGVVSETGAFPASLTGFQIDPATDLPGFDAGRVTLDSRNVFADFQGLSFQPGQNVTLDLTFAPPAVPEASTTVSLGLLLGLGAVLRLGRGMVAARRKRV